VSAVPRAHDPDPLELDDPSQASGDEDTFRCVRDEIQARIKDWPATTR
jgi:hypothetical protein